METVEAVKKLIQTGMPEQMTTGYKLAYTWLLIYLRLCANT